MDFRKKLFGGPSTRLLFEHIPKCGGTSLWRFLQNQYSHSVTFHVSGKNPTEDIQRFQEMPANARSKFRLVAGHGAHNLIPFVGDAFVKFTVLREPVDRVISYYYYIKRRPNHARHQEITENISSLKAYLESGKDGFMNNNYIRRFGPGTYPELIKDPNSAIEQTFASMIEKFDHIGILEEMKELMDVLHQSVSFSTPYDGARENVTQKRPGAEEFDAEVLELIQAMNAADIALYERVKAHWSSERQENQSKHAK